MALIWAGVAFLLAVATAYQATFPNGPWAQSRLFKFSLMVLAVCSGLFLAFSSIQNDRDQAELKESMAGISPTIFDRDLELDLHFRFKLAGHPVGAVNQPFVTLTVLPKESTVFCKIGATSTPVVDSFYGALFPLDPAPKANEIVGFGDPTTQIFKFDFNSKFSGNDFDVDQKAGAVPLIAARHMTLAEYNESQFIAELVAPGSVEEIDEAMLYAKGKPIPLNFVRTGDRWLASTVFRPTWELRCKRSHDGKVGVKR